VVVGRRHDERGQLHGRELRLQPVDGVDHRQQRLERRLVVGQLGLVRVGDVVADRGDEVGAAVDHRLQRVTEGGRVAHRCDRAVHDDDARDLGVLRREPHGQRATHRQACDHDPIAARRELGVGGIGGLGPVVPSCRRHVFDGGAVAGQTGELGREPFLRERAGEAAQRLWAAGETVQDERAVRAAGRRERFRAGQHRGYRGSRHHISVERPPSTASTWPVT
jgi:hypothetical protein